MLIWAPSVLTLVVSKRDANAQKAPMQGKKGEFEQFTSEYSSLFQRHWGLLETHYQICLGDSALFMPIRSRFLKSKLS